MRPGSRPTTRFLDPEVIARLRGLEVRARSAVSGTLSGRHRSVFRGYSVEFAEHRPYVPGDDIRHIDWRIYGRKDRYFIKQYEEETNLQCDLLLDVSRSMGFTSGGPSKLAYGCYLAASLAYLVIGQSDAAGLITFDDRVRLKLPAATGKAHLANILGRLDELEPTGRTDVRILLHRLAEELRRRSLVVLISDLIADVDEIVGGLEHLMHGGHELVVMHVMDDHEWRFPLVENVLFEGMETDDRLLADPQSLRAGYLAALERFTQRVRARCLDCGADYVPVNTRTPVAAVLAGYLSRRGKRGTAALDLPITGGEGGVS